MTTTSENSRESETAPKSIFRSIAAKLPPAMFDNGATTLSTSAISEYQLKANRSVSERERAEVLAALIEERKPLLKAKRLGKATPIELQFLADLNDYVTQLENRQVEAERQLSDVWQQLEQLAKATLALAK